MARVLGPEGYQTFQVTSPIATHTKVVQCGEDVDCALYRNGWRMQLDLATELGQRQAYYIKHHSGRSYTIESQVDGIVSLRFAANQPCFNEHRVKLDRPEIYRVKGGDARGNPTGILTRTHKKPEFWVEEFAENQDRIKSIIEKG